MGLPHLECAVCRGGEEEVSGGVKGQATDGSRVALVVLQ